MAEEERTRTAPPFFNTTFAIHRLSPLYVGEEGLTETRLEELARRLRGTLVGDVVRGIQISLESTETAWGQVGPLQTIKLRWFQQDEVLGDSVPESIPEAAPEARGLWLEIRHENAAYHALLLPCNTPKPPSSTDWAMQAGAARPPTSYTNSINAQFCDLPLLLLRMPQQLQKVISDWLSSTFDCRVNKVTLGTRSIISVWEDWLEEVGPPTKGSDISVTLTFNAPLSGSSEDGDEDTEDVSETPGLRSLEVSVELADLQKFIRRGDRTRSQAPDPSLPWSPDERERRKLAGSNADDGWGWRSADSQDKTPFTNALARYLDNHLALKLFHPSVRVHQISCSAFNLAQSRLKIVRGTGESGTEKAQRGAWAFVDRLGEKIRGGSIPTVFQ